MRVTAHTVLGTRSQRPPLPGRVGSPGGQAGAQAGAPPTWRAESRPRHNQQARAALSGATTTIKLPLEKNPSCTKGNSRHERQEDGRQHKGLSQKVAARVSAAAGSPGSAA